MAPISRWVSALASGIPYLVLSYVLIQVWIEPMAWDDGQWVPFGVGLLLMEFLLLHSGAFIGAMVAMQTTVLARLKYLAALLAVYTLLAWAFAMSTGGAALMKVFVAVMAGRLVSVVLESGTGSQGMTARSALGIALYVVIGGLTVMIDVPELGITRDVLNEVYSHRGGGLWEQQPQRAIAGAALYFGLMGLAELLLFTGVFDKKNKPS